MKGVSEVVGSLLVFVVVISTAGLLYVMSYPTMVKAQDEVNYRSALSNLFELREILDRVKSGNEPVTTKKVYLYGGSLRNLQLLEFRVGGGSVHIRGLVLNISGRELYLEGSGIFERKTGLYSLLVVPPNLGFTKDAGGICNMSVVVYNITGNLSVGGKEYTISISLTGKERFTGNVLEIYSSFPEEWARAIEESAKTVGCNPTISVFSDHVQIINVGRVTLTKYDVEVR